MTSLVGGSLLVGGLGPVPPAPLNPALFRASHTHRCAYSLCDSGHRRVLEYSFSYSPSTRVTNYLVSAALVRSWL